jgi:toxin ParE1/3/4
VRAIKAWTLRTWGVDQWRSYLSELETSFRRLADVPGMGTACDQIRDGYRRFPVGEHFIYYRIEAAGVVVVRVYPQRMLLRREMLGEGRA